MVRFNFDQDKGILHGESYGEVSIQGMLDVLDYLKNNLELPRNLLILEDARQAHPKFHVKELIQVGEKVKEVVPLYQTIKHAVIHIAPKNTVYAMMFAQKHAPTNYQIKVFCTEEGAIAWLLKK
jgi:hypothetical protein